MVRSKNTATARSAAITIRVYAFESLVSDQKKKIIVKDTYNVLVPTEDSFLSNSLYLSTYKRRAIRSMNPDTAKLSDNFVRFQKNIGSLIPIPRIRTQDATFKTFVCSVWAAIYARKHQENIAID